MAELDKGAADQLWAAIERGRLWATPEETAKWLETESGQRIAAMIEKYRRMAA